MTSDTPYEGRTDARPEAAVDRLFDRYRGE